MLNDVTFVWAYPQIFLVYLSPFSFNRFSNFSTVT